MSHNANYEADDPLSSDADWGEVESAASSGWGTGLQKIYKENKRYLCVNKTTNTLDFGKTAPPTVSSVLQKRHLSQDTAESLKERMSRMVTTSEAFKEMQKRKKMEESGFVVPPPKTYENIKNMYVGQLSRSMDLLGPRYKYRKGFLRTSHEIRPWIPRDVEAIQKEIDGFSSDWNPRQRQEKESQMRHKFIGALRENRERMAKPN